MAGRNNPPRPNVGPTLNFGIGSMFQEEGPGVGPSSALADELRRIRQLKGGSPRLGDFEANAREREDDLRAGQMEPSGLEKALREMRKYQETDLFKSPGADLSRLAKTPIMEKAAERISVSRPDSPMTMGVGANELSPLDQIAEQLSKIQPRKPEQKLGAGDEAAAQKIIAENAQKKAASAIENKMSSDNLIEDSFSGAMADYINAVRGTGPDKKERTLDDYKKEFAEATGIDISGKVDKSQALMAMGLALMQNKAGKGFNVGKALSAIGAAGEAALPALQAAKDKAQTAALAAGKYALESRSSDRAKDEAASLAGKQRGKYWVYKKGGKGAEFANFDEGEFVDLNPFELNKLIENKDFAGQYEFIDASDRMSILQKRAEGIDLGDMWGSFERISLIGGKADDVPPELQVLAAPADANYKGVTPTGFKLAEKPETIVRRFSEMQKSINSGAKKFESLLGLLEQGVTIPEQFLSKANEVLVSFGIGETDSITEAKRELKNIAIDRATEILKESGKTLSDNDRKLVVERIGEISWGSADVGVIRKQLKDIYDLTVEQPQRNLDKAISWLEQNAGISFAPAQDDMPTQEELDAMNKANGTNLTMDDFKKGS